MPFFTHNENQIPGSHLPDARTEIPSLLLPMRSPVSPMEIDWSNPLARGLTHFVVAQDGWFYDLVTGKRVLQKSGDSPSLLTFEGTDRGASLNTISNNSTMSTILIPKKTYKDISIGAHGSINDNSNSGALFAVGSDATDGEYIWLSSWRSFGTPKDQLSCRWVNLDEIIEPFFTPPLVEYEPAVLFITCETLPANNSVGYYNGIAGDTEIGINSDSNTTIDRLCVAGLNRDTSFSNMAACNFYSGWVYDRALTPGEVYKISENPYQFLVPK